jgi:hypothetical protein
MELNTLVKVCKQPPSYESVAVTTVVALFQYCLVDIGFFAVFAHVPGNEFPPHFLSRYNNPDFKFPCQPCPDN